MTFLADVPFDVGDGQMRTLRQRLASLTSATYAAAGTDRATATPITSNVVTVAGGSGGLVLPDAGAGSQPYYIVMVGDAETISIYPPAGHSFIGAVADVPLTVSKHSAVMVWQFFATQWGYVGTAPSTGGTGTGGGVTTNPPVAAAVLSETGDAALSETGDAALSEATGVGSTIVGPRTTLHYTQNGNFDASGNYLPGAVGFNLADVTSVAVLNSLPVGVKGLVYLGYQGGADATFQAKVAPFIGNSRVFGFYLADEPDPSGRYGPLFTVDQLKAQSDYIHSVMPAAKTFIVLMNQGSPTNPVYPDFSPANTGIDLYAIDPYPVRPEFTGGVNYGVIAAAVAAAVRGGVPAAQLVPTYQCFGGGGYTSYSVPTADQLTASLAAWKAALPTPAFDAAYSWGAQQNDTSLASLPALQAVLSSLFKG